MVTFRKPFAVAVVAGLILVAGGAEPARAVNADHGARVVSADPDDTTPHVMNGSVQSVLELGSRVVVAGTFTTVSPAATFSNTADDVRRSGIFAFDRATGRIDPGFDPSLGGAANSLATDGTSIWAAGTFTSVGPSPAIKRIVKLTSSGQVVGAFVAVPNAAVNEVVVRGSRVFVGGAFTSIRSGTAVSRSAFAVLDATTGRVSADAALPFGGVFNGGATKVIRMDVNPAGTRVVAVGNFLTVAGVPRSQLAVLDTPPGAPATLSAWATDRFAARCSTKVDSYLRDVDVSPDGGWFVVTTTGGFLGGSPANVLCDTATRWELGTTTGAGRQPTWTAYTGGDTLYGVAVTGAAVYVGGHHRWFNNPFQGDQAGPGAVPREGISALDPVNGLPLPWNPGRSRGVGAQAVHATATGLWVGSDTTRLGRETHGRLAFLPLSGGSTVTAVPAARLPGTAFGVNGSSVVRRPLDAAGAPAGAATTAATGAFWSTVRGAFWLDGILYAGTSAGDLVRLSFNPATGAAGPVTAVDLHDDPGTGARIPFALSGISGMFYDPVAHRIYYTVTGDARLFWRWFTPDGAVVGAETFTAGTGGNDLSGVAGLTLAGGKVLYGSRTDGRLRAAPFAAGPAGAGITGRSTTLGSDTTWRYSALFVPNG